MMRNVQKVQLDRSRQSQQKSRCVSVLLKPLRIFQFLMVTLLFVFTIYTIVRDPTPMSHLVCILLIVLSGVYVFVLAVDLISYFAKNVLNAFPMSIFSLIGLVLFGVVGILLICSAYTPPAIYIAITTLCLLAALLFLLDVAMVFTFWKRRCSVCKRCCNGDVAEFLPRRDKDPRVTPVREAMKRDITTSLSDVRLPRELKDKAKPDHSYRKIEYPHRRQYVDRPTCVPSICNLGVAQIQTDPHKVSVVESQTPKTIMRETPMQTLSKCEFCYQQMYSFHSPPVKGESATSVSPHIQSPSQPTYPAIVQFVRGGEVPCCPGCICGTQIQQKQQQQQKRHNSYQQPQQLTPERIPSRTLMSETTQQVAKPAYKSTEKKMMPRVAETVTSPSYVKSDKKPQALSDATISKRKVTEITKDAKPTKVDQEFEKEITTCTKDKQPQKNPNDTIDEKNERMHEESIEREEDLIDEIEQLDSDEIERNKGGGEHEVVIYQQFMRVAQENIESPRRSVATQMSTMLLTPTNRTKPKTFLNLKPNKVDPIQDENVADENLHERATSKNVTQAVQKEKFTESEIYSSPIEHENIDYSLCKRPKIFQRLKPTSDNSRYHTAFKDRNGRYFCEFCAPLESKKVTNRLESTDLKKLKCTNCKFALRERRVKTANVGMIHSRLSKSDD